MRAAIVVVMLLVADQAWAQQGIGAWETMGCSASGCCYSASGLNRQGADRCQKPPSTCDLPELLVASREYSGAITRFRFNTIILDMPFELAAAPFFTAEERWRQAVEACK